MWVSEPYERRTEVKNPAFVDCQKPAGKAADCSNRNSSAGDLSQPSRIPELTAGERFFAIADKVLRASAPPGSFSLPAGIGSGMPSFQHAR
jgi:hypothetical protein